MTIEAHRDVTRTLSDIAAEEIRALLGRRRMSQAELARRLDVTGAWLNYRLTGRQPIDLNDLQVIALLVLVGCIIGAVSIFGGSSKKTPAASSTPQPTATSAVPADTAAGQKICQLQADGGSFYLLLTSSTDHNFSACNSATAYSGTIDTLLDSGHGMDRRCFLDDTFIAQNGASGAIYSSTKAGDLAAAHAYCAAHGGTN